MSKVIVSVKNGTLTEHWRKTFSEVLRIIPSGAQLFLYLYTDTPFGLRYKKHIYIGNTADRLRKADYYNAYYKIIS